MYGRTPRSSFNMLDGKLTSVGMARVFLDFLSDHVRHFICQLLTLVLASPGFVLLSALPKLGCFMLLEGVRGNKANGYDSWTSSLSIALSMTAQIVLERVLSHRCDIIRHAESAEWDYIEIVQVFTRISLAMTATLNSEHV